MAKFLPKSIPDENWIKLEPDRVYAIKSSGQSEVNLRIGTGVGLYLSFVDSRSEGKRMINAVTYDTGEMALVSPMVANELLVLGRTHESGIKVNHAIVSRNHAEIKLEGNILMIKDLGSTNGTYVNKSNPHFDIKDYIEKHPPEKGKEGTLDWIHEEFGPTLDDFLMKYKKENDL